MRVLVTGGAGFIGSHVCEQLLEGGHEVAVLDDLSSGARENIPRGAAFYEVDLRDRDRTFRAVADFRPNVISHQAAQASVVVSLRDPRLDAEVNILGGLNLVDACTTLPNVAVERVVFASTGGAIYGEVFEGSRASEATVPKPISPYAIHKLAFEQLLAVYGAHRGLAATALRYANVYGPRQNPHGEAGVVAIFFDALLSGRPVRVNARQEPGDAGCVRDYVFVSDVARMNLLAISGRTTEPTINVGTGVATTTRRLAEAVRALVGADAPIEAGAVRAGDVERSVLDPALCQGYLNGVTSLEDGLTRTRAFYAAQKA